MLHCTSCGLELADNARFCSQCGTAVGGARATAGGEAPATGDNHSPMTSAAPAGTPVRLADGSERLWTGWPSRKRHLPMLAVSLVVTVAGAIGGAMLPPLLIVAGVGLLGLLWTAGRMLLEPLMLRYWLTADRLFIRRGLLRITTDQTELIRVDDITVEQGIIDRIFGIGTVRVMCRTDMSHQAGIDLQGIDDPVPVSELIRAGSQALRRKGGMFIEQV